MTPTATLPRDHEVGAARPLTEGPPVEREPSRWRKMTRVLVGIVAFFAVGNAVILGASLWARQAAGASGVDVPAEVESIHNFEAVDDRIWRGGAPGDADYEALADAGATTVIDLRAEEDLDVPTALLDDLGLTLVEIPMRDGQAPTPAQVQRFMAAVEGSEGPVFVHCGAGVGRTGTMVAAYRVASGQSAATAVRANLAVGPPSLEQIAFAASLEPGTSVERPNVGIVAVSRVLDAPRRGWKVLEGIL